MTDPLLRLMTWLSPSFPVGAFSYSQGLEWAVEEGTVGDRETLQGWIAGILTHGSGRTDSALLVAAWRAVASQDAARLAAVTELATALSPTAERALETEAQGAAFLAAARAGWPEIDAHPTAPGRAAPYPVAVGAVGAICAIPVEPVGRAYQHAIAANLVSAGLRLIPLGQSDGVRVLAALESTILAVGAEAAEAGLSGLGAFTPLADIASLRHETQYTRLFRS